MSGVLPGKYNLNPGFLSQSKMLMNETRDNSGFSPGRKNWWIGYLVTLVVELTVTELLSLLHVNYPFLHYSTIYFIIIALIAYAFGLGPTILAVLLGFYLFASSFVEPLGRAWHSSVSAQDWERLFSFGLGALLIGVTTLVIRLSRERARHFAHELTISNDRTKAVLESITDAFFALGHDWHFTYFNHGAEEILLKKQEELIGKSIWEEMPELMDSPFGQECVKAMEERVAREFETMHTDGIIHMGIRIYPSRSGISIYIRDTTEISELRKAEKRQLELLQQALVPPAPSMPEGWNAAAAYYPAFTSEKIGGDFYDVFPTRDGHVGILIGDVSGKGIEVASLAVATRNMVRAYAFGMSAHSALYYSNDILCKFQTDEPSFVTVLLILLDAASGKFTYANAGHPPAAIYGPDGAVRFLEIGNPPVGLIEHQQFDIRHESIGEREKIILFTDGIIEARKNNILFDMHGVERVLHIHGDKQPAHLVDEIFSAASSWSSGPIEDDATILIIERHNPAA